MKNIGLKSLTYFLNFFFLSILIIFPITLLSYAFTDTAIINDVNDVNKPLTVVIDVNNANYIIKTLEDAKKMIILQEKIIEKQDRIIKDSNIIIKFLDEKIEKLEKELSYKKT